MTDQPKCKYCGAAWAYTLGRGIDSWECGTLRLPGRDSRSNDCLIVELEAKVARLEKSCKAYQEEQEEALGILGCPDPWDQLLSDWLIPVQAIIEKLPKCWRLDEEGKLVQDVPVTPLMKVWVRSGILPVDGEMLAIPKAKDELSLSAVAHGVGFYVSPSVCYSTLAAAEAARDEKASA